MKHEQTIGIVLAAAILTVFIWMLCSGCIGSNVNVSVLSSRGSMQAQSGTNAATASNTSEGGGGNMASNNVSPTIPMK